MGFPPGQAIPGNLGALSSGPQNLQNVSGQDPWGGAVRYQTPLSQAQLSAVTGSPSAIPPAMTPANQALLNAPNQAMQPGLWARLMNVIGNPSAGGFKMPGTTVGAPAGQIPPALPLQPPVFPGGPAPPGMGAYFRQQQFPTAGAGGNQNLMMQYMALQQLMRGS